MFKLIKAQCVSAAAFGLVCHQMYLFVRKLPAGSYSLFYFEFLLFIFKYCRSVALVTLISSCIQTEMMFVISNHKLTDLKS